MIIGTTTGAKFVMLAPVSVIFWQTFEGGKDDNIQIHITSIKLEFRLQCVKVLFCQHIFWEVAESRSKVGFQTPVAYHLRSVYCGRTTRSSNQSISHTEAALLVSSFPLTSLRSTLCFSIWSHLTPPFIICSPNLILHLGPLLHPSHLPWPIPFYSLHQLNPSHVCHSFSSRHLSSPFCFLFLTQRRSDF